MDEISNRFANLSPLKQAVLALEEVQARLAESESTRFEPIAIVGMGCRFPHASDPQAFWNLLHRGEDAIVEVPPSRWAVDDYYDPDPETPGKMSTRWGGFLDEVDSFDPEFFGISPREAASMDPQQRLLLEVAWEALENAGQGPHDLAACKTGVFVGIAGDEYAQIVHRNRDLTQFNSYFASGIARSVAGGRISYTLGIEGPNLSIDTACSSSLVAVHLACLSLRMGECRMALAGGANVVLSPQIGIALSKARMMAADGRCKAFDSRADGFVRSEGCGIVVLKRLSHAIADGDNILALIRGSAVNQDGRSSGLTVPNRTAQEAVIRQALAMAKVKPEEVSYIETHGTGTSLGDPIEAQAIRSVIGAGKERQHPLVIGSVKTNIGHLEAAAGIAGLIKVVLSLQKEEIPANLHFREMNPHIDWAGLPVEIPVEAQSWRRGKDRRIAGVSAFGFSGTNAHLILEEAPSIPVAPEAADRPFHILTLSARTETALSELRTRCARELEHSNAAPADVCHTMAAGRGHFEHRIAMIGSSLEQFCLGLGNNPHGCRIRDREGIRPAFLFPGQGTQYAGMARELYESERVVRRALDECAELLKPELERPLLDVLWGSATALLDKTAYTQPAIFAVEYALAELWRHWGIRPTVLLGHSVGEYVAACVAGVFSLADGLRLIAARARMMQHVAGHGVMTAVMASENVVREAIFGLDGRVSIAAFNAPESLVISGYANEVTIAEERLRAARVRIQRLAVSHAFHSPQMAEMEEAFERVAAGIDFHAPVLRMISSVTGEVVAPGEMSDPRYWRRQVRQPVRFRQALETLARLGCRECLETGPGTTLAGLGGQVIPIVDMLWATSLTNGRGEWEQILQSVRELYLRGADVDWAAFNEGRNRRRLQLPTYPFERQRYWLQTVPEEPAMSSARPGHPLLGTRVDVAGKTGTHIWQREIGIGSVPWLADHCVHGKVVLPMTAYLEMLIVAARQIAGSEAALEQITIERALILRANEMAPVQIVANDDHLDVYGQRNGEWTLHATARVGRPGENSRAESLQSLKERFSREWPTDAFYETLAGFGLAFGPSFRNLRSLWVDDGEALGRIDSLSLSSAESLPYTIHPALLDACVQVVGGAFGERCDAVYMPIGVDSFEIRGKPDGELWSRVSLRSGTGVAGDLADVEVVSASGNFRAVLQGIALRRTGAASLDRAANEKENLFRVEWRLAPREDRLELSPADLLHAVEDAATKIGAGNSTLLHYGPFQRELNSLCVNYILRAFVAMEYVPTAASRISTNRLAETCRVVNAQKQLFARLLEILAESGVLRPAGRGEWLVADVPVLHDAAPVVRSLLRDYPAFSSEIDFTECCGSQLANVLQGRRDPLDVLFPAGSTAAAEKLYQDSPVAVAGNGLARAAVAAAIDRLPAHRRIRILEIGGGTGGTTKAVASLLPPGRTEYFFTDVSPVFVERARLQFEHHPFFRFQILDIERDPERQALPVGHFDVVIAANVLHATAVLSRTLAHVRKLLAPGGVLVLLEMTAPEYWIDLTFGMTAGWWRFEDRTLRSSYPLLSSGQWAGALMASGFEAPLARSVPFCPTALLLARHAVSTNQAKGSWLILSDRGGVGAALAKSIAGQGGLCTLVFSGQPFAEIISAGAPWHGVIHLRSLDMPSEDGLSATHLLELATELCTSLADLVRSLASVQTDAPPRLWIVTSNSQSVNRREQSLAILQAPIWGVARSLAMEHPEFRCVRMDLSNSLPEVVDSLVREFLEPEPEDEIAFRESSRFVPRLVPLIASEQDTSLCRVSLGARGTLDNISIEPAHRKQPGPGQVEIAVEAAGMVFRDVLNALDLYPGDAGPLGGECAGRIISVGFGVTGWRCGDEVVAMARAAHDAYVLADARLVARKPEGWSSTEAATAITSYLTAAHALEDLAQVQSGDRLLVHAGAGGVGLAAIRIARRAGAEVFATAGSAEKRALLKSLGVPHVYSSRSLDFSSEILDETRGEGVDVVLNSLADGFIEATFNVLARSGRFIEIGKRGIWTAERVQSLDRNISYHIVDLGESALADPIRIGALLRRTMSLAGTLGPLPHRAFPFADAINAYRYMAQARHIGKIVLQQRRAEVPIDPAAIYLITGGLGSLGLETARWLVDKGARHLALVGRSEPDIAARAMIAEMERQHASISVRLADVADLARMKEIFEEWKTNGLTLRGVIHCAGSLDDGVLREQTADRFKCVLSPKVAGSWVLHTLTRDLSLDFFVMFSSTASVLGSPGQANHAAANAFEDALAQRRRHDGLPAISIDWGAWGETGAAVREDFAARRKLLGVATMSTSEALSLFESILRSGESQAIAAAMDWGAYASYFPGGNAPQRFRELAKPAAKVVDGSVREAEGRRIDGLAAAPEASRRPILEDYARSIACRVLGLPSERKIDPEQPLHQFGLDSLMAVEFRNLLAATLKLPLTATFLFDYPTIADMTNYLMRALFPAAAPTNPGTGSDSLLDRIEQLSEENVDDLLAQMTGDLR